MTTQHSFNLSLTDELRSFVDRQSGPGTTFSTPSEFLRALIREKKERLELEELRSGVLEGYADIRAGRVREYTGDLRAMLDDARARRDARCG
jgi:Arc/MetJ-type ribon-helix-helix transcriptional regulator